jgi:hypothetical protein
MVSHELLIVIEILRETAIKFKSLDNEAISALHNKGDSSEYQRKLIEKAQLLIDLEKAVAVPLSTLRGAELSIAVEVKRNIAEYSCVASEALERKNKFWLATLLIEQGSQEGDKNNLEKLIDVLDLLK